LSEEAIYLLHKTALDPEVLFTGLLLAVDVIRPADHLPALQLLVVEVGEVEGEEGLDGRKLGSIVVLRVEVADS
jgi:hypothetical protein